MGFSGSVEYLPILVVLADDIKFLKHNYFRISHESVCVWGRGAGVEERDDQART